MAAGSLVLAACSGSEGDSSAGPVDLRMVMWSANDAHHEVFNQIGAAYVEENPDVVSSISFEPLTGSSYVNALTTQIAGGDAPDLAWISEANAAQFVQSGVLHNLSPAFESSEGYAVDDLLDGAFDVWSQDENIYGYPFSNSPFGIFVNRDLVSAAGEPDPRELMADEEWTWDSLMAVAAQVAQEEGQAGFEPSASPYAGWNDALGAMWLSWGASPWSADGTECTMNSPEMVEFFDWFHHHVFETGAVPGPGEEFDFASGQVAFKLAQLSSSGALDDSFEWDFLPLPAGPAGSVPVVGQGGVGVVARGENPEIAADFLAYFTNPQNSELLAQFFPPPRSSVLTVETLSAAAPSLTEQQIEETVIAQSVDAVTKVGHVRMSELADPVRVGLDSLWTADGDAQSVLDQVCEDIAPVLESE
ncbi:extracellular solute-binding protein [Ruania suaedae]|uniref:ABC transporter substrate-binding protein n=1 Tax=Ruania suaedae TaxID=2897774 RepID=UPI001E5CF9FA|nr:extracellular solute-binding protein [Ruania suaedae]UFU03258.1 extracellular solute-binding protein [Ruania suaedae]